MVNPGPDADDLDFTSALYLGLRHPSVELPTWHALTTGQPAVLRPPAGSGQVERLLASLLGCPAAVLAPSTLHLFWDLFGQFPGPGAAVLVDAGSYPIARGGVQRAAARGIPVLAFHHHDPGDLDRRLRRRCRGRRPVVVCDGLDTGNGRAAPLAGYLEVLRRHGGWLVVDDTQALGILGRDPGTHHPYGRGGGGSLPWHRIAGPDILSVVSLAKGLGVPVAALAGAGPMVRHFRHHSETRMHCSPPALPLVAAARRALEVNRLHGDALRRRLAERVKRLRRRLAEAGLATAGGLFPFQCLSGLDGEQTLSLYRSLRRAGIRPLLLAPDAGHAAPRLAFAVTARHRPEVIDHLGERVARNLARDGSSPANRVPPHPRLTTGPARGFPDSDEIGREFNPDRVAPKRRAGIADFTE